ncbi:MAG: hypothetical protein ACT4UP_11390 [Gammaproteobacteria bacterium]
MFMRILAGAFAFSVLTIAVAGRVTAQARPPAVQEPEYNNEFHYLDPSTYSLTRLEKAPLENKVRARAGLGGFGAKYRNPDEGAIQFTATKEPGEYVLVMAPASGGPGANVPSHGFCFGVDCP